MDFALRVGFDPRVCRAYRAQTNGKVERNLRYGGDNLLPGVRPRDLDASGSMGVARRFPKVAQLQRGRPTRC